MTNRKTDKTETGTIFHKGLKISVALLALAMHTAFADDAYVASSGGQAINTGYYLNSNTKLEIDFQITTIVNDGYVFGASGSGGTSSCLYVNGNGNLEPNVGGWLGNIGGAATTGRRTVVYDIPNRSVTLYEHGSTTPKVTKTFSADKGTATYPIMLFANCTTSTGAGVEKFGTCRIYSFKVWEKNGGNYDIVHSWTPAIKGGEVGFVDSVDGSFIREHRFAAAPLTIGGDYATLEDDGYLESNGTTVINSGILPDTDLSLEIDYALTTADQPDARIVGDNSTQTVEFYVNQGGTAMAFCIGKGWPGGTAMYKPDTSRHTFIADIPNSIVYLVTGFTTNNTYATKDAVIDGKGTIPLALFGRISSANGVSENWTAGRGKVRIYGAKFYRNGTLVKNLVPCVKGDVPGFRDTVGGTFHTGTCNVDGLSAGGNVQRIVDDGFVQFIGNDSSGVGGFYIDTGYKPGPDTRLELDYAFSSNKVDHGDWYLMAAGDSADKSTFIHYATKKTLGNCLGGNDWKTTGLPDYAPTNTAFVRRTAILDSPNKAATLITSGYVNYANTNDTFSTIASQSSGSLKIGSTGGGGGGFAPARIYGLKIFESGSLLYDFVPTVQNGTPGLKSGSTFVPVTRNLSVAVAGKVIVGGAVSVSSDGDCDAYAESFGAQAMNTEYFVKSATKIEIDCQFTFNAKNTTIFGTTEGSGTTTLLWANNNGSLEPNFGGWCGNIGGASTLDRRTLVYDLPSKSVALYAHGGTTPIATKDSSKVNDKGESDRPLGLFAMCKSTDGTTFTNHGYARIYRMTIWEGDSRKREYVPCVINGTPCMYDLENETALSSSGLVVAGRGYAGAEEWIATPQDCTITKTTGTKTLTGLAVGAQSYEWYEDGVLIPGETSESITLNWDRAKAKANNYAHTYSVKPVYTVFNERVVGEAVSATVEYTPLGMVIIIK